MKIQDRGKLLARPWWRDYVAAYVLIGLGFTLSSPGMALRPLWYGVGALGGVVFLCAVGWSLIWGRR